MTRETLGEVDHTNPFTEEVFGAVMVYRRGPVVVTDGGATDGDEPTTDDHDHGCGHERQPSTEEAGPRLGDIDHTPPYGAGVARDRIYERGRGENA
ncbi:hypothetical protein [Halocatena salina]|uniref:Uncharacterized protein n=1 Tax=Halocatena salina TaxID=2934340 RepID=A0A8U0A1P3_9EURY|nr:hypothetical protein [Halocatena salina]UPM42776.1 hypothetical protein MW046_12555 [Halocatena salina]